MGRSRRRSKKGSGSRSRVSGRGSSKSRSRRRVGDDRRVTSRGLSRCPCRIPDAMAVCQVSIAAMRLVNKDTVVVIKRK